ncbi:MAG: hypothetical protein GY757_39145 [bacterium]|nr:hypothetical protein [bacterium]
MKVCSNCVLPESYPGITFDKNGVCNYCDDYTGREVEEEKQHFKSEDEVKECLKKYKELKRDYDVLVSVSGGVDSSFALIKMVKDFKLKPLVFHNDHGYEDETAADNVKKLCKELKVDLITWQYDLEFMKKLWKYFNEIDIEGMSPCYICGNVLYFHAVHLADKLGIPLVVNGYSKGQVEMMQDQEKGREWFGEMVEIILELGDKEFLDTFTKKFSMLSKQRIYRTRQDLDDSVDPEKIMVIPFFIFKFYKTDKETLKKECIEIFDWKPIRQSYPYRTTNCDIIWLNTYCDLKKRKYSLYQEEYATLVRSGEMTRQQALEDLRFEPPDGLIERLAGEIELDLEDITG